MSDALPPTRLAAGALVAGRYRVSSVIGEGAHGVVYLARREAGSDGPIGDAVALKVIHRHVSGNPQIARRFHREAKILRQLEGEHIVRLYDFFEDDGLLMIALEHVTGTTLEAMIANQRPLDLDAAIEITLQVCAALGVAHANGVVHRDLKPANVLIERREDGGASPSGARGTASARGLRVKVVDFGLGKVLHADQMTTGLTEHGMIFGTPEYMAPEMARGDEVDARSDLYAAGVMLFEMAVGEVPFQARSAMETMTAHLTAAAPSPRKARPSAGISPALEAVILRALAKDPADRFASARELAEAIAAVRDQPLVIAPRAGADAAEIGEGDTDLHLERQALGQARTLRADELLALSGDQGAAEASPRPPPPAVVHGRPQEIPVTLGRAPRASAPAVDPGLARTMRAEIEDEPTAVSGAAPPKTTYVWAIVAVVAALVGMAIGIVVGMR